MHRLTHPRKLGTVVVALIVTAATLCFTPAADAVWVSSDSWKNLSPFKIFCSNTVRRKPTSATQKTLVLADYRIDKTPVNEKGIEVGVTHLANGTVWAYRDIVIKHCEISNLTRTPGWHSDFIRIFGGGSKKQDVAMRVTIEDCNLYNGEVLPIMIQDGEFEKITLKNIRMSNVASSAQFATINSGSIQEVWIENCPNQSFAFSGRPGSIGICYVKNSPGATVKDCLNKAGRSGMKIVYLD